MKCNRSIGITGESSNFRRSATSVYRSARLLFTGSVFGTIGISRGSRSCQPFEGAPLSCGFQLRKWSNGNAAGSPFPTSYDVQFYSFLFSGPLSLLGFRWLSFIRSFFLSACHRPHLGSPQSYYVRCFVEELQFTVSATCPVGRAYRKFISPNRFVRTIYSIYFGFFRQTNLERTEI